MGDPVLVNSAGGSIGKSDQRLHALSDGEMKAALLDMMNTFGSFCERHNLSYCLAGGTCLGAVRHHGFIPWDDDVDLFLSRPDFERLKGMTESFKVETGLELVTYLNSSWEHARCIRVENPAIIVNHPVYELDIRLWLDVLVVDGLPAGDVSGIYRKVDFWLFVLRLSVSKPGRGKTRLRGFLKVPAWAVVNLLHLGDSASAHLDAVARGTAYGSTPYCGAVASGIYGPGERMTLAEFEEKVPMAFEGYEFPVMSCWDSYLSGIYGDYMTPPPDSKRKGHGFTAYRAEPDDNKIGECLEQGGASK